MSLGDVAGRLTEVLTTIQDARVSLNAATDQINDASSMFSDALAGSSSYDAQDVSDRYRSALDKLDDLAAWLDAADTAIDIMQVRLVGDSPAPGLPATSPARELPDHRAQPHRPAKTIPDRVDQHRVDRLRDQLPPPVEKGRNQKTHGRWIDPDGRTHHEVSGNDEKAGAVARFFKEDMKWGVLPAAVTHVEMKLAVHMIRNGIRSADVVVNNTPCEGRMGCDRLLPDVLPAGYTLTVHGPGDFRQEYKGKRTAR